MGGAPIDPPYQMQCSGNGQAIDQQIVQPLHANDFHVTVNVDDFGDNSDGKSCAVTKKFKTGGDLNSFGKNCILRHNNIGFFDLNVP